MAKAPTRNDVAKLAGVSPAVVSYVMNGSNYVSPEKREAVEKAMRELHYSPNSFARNLKMKSSRHIALIGDTLQDGQDNLFALISRELFKKGYYSSFSYSQISDDFISMLLERGFDGVVMTCNGYSTSQLNRIADAGIKMVLHQSRQYENLSEKIVLAGPDYYDGIRRAVEFLVLKGHKRIGFVSPIGFRTTGVESNDFRTRGYVDAMESNHLEIVPGNVSTHTQDVASICEDVLDMLSNVETRPTALVVADDYLAVCIVQYLNKLGLKVPEDVALVGWSDSLYARVATPKLSTVNCDTANCAKIISEKMIGLLNGEEQENECVRVKLMIRDST